MVIRKTSVATVVYKVSLEKTFISICLERTELAVPLEAEANLAIFRISGIFLYEFQFVTNFFNCLILLLFFKKLNKK
jgi:hypothetical protein